MRHTNTEKAFTNQGCVHTNLGYHLDHYIRVAIGCAIKVMVKITNILGYSSNRMSLCRVLYFYGM